MFLFIFFPVTLFFYFIVKNDKVKNIVLVIASLIFYSWGEPVWVCLLIFSSILDYTVSLGIEKYRGKKITKLFIALSVVINLGLLAAFKYSDSSFPRSTESSTSRSMFRHFLCR